MILAEDKPGGQTPPAELGPSSSMDGNHIVGSVGGVILIAN